MKIASCSMVWNEKFFALAPGSMLRFDQSLRDNHLTRVPDRFVGTL